MTVLSNDLQDVTRISSYALIVRDKSILLCRLSGKMNNEKGRWTLPGGGIEFGESPEQAVIREVLEETGYQISVSRLLDIHSDVFHNVDTRVHVIRVVYEARITGGEMRPEADGSTDLCDWVAIDSLGKTPIVEVVRRGFRIWRQRNGPRKGGKRHGAKKKRGPRTPDQVRQPTAQE